MHSISLDCSILCGLWTHVLKACDTQHIVRLFHTGWPVDTCVKGG